MKKRLLALMMAMVAVLMTACGGASYTPGVYTETGYESEFLGLRFTTPEGFALATEEELSQLMGVSMDNMENVSELQKKYAELVTVYEMMVTDETGVVNGQIILEKTGVNVDTYIDAFTGQLESQMSGMSVELDETATDVEIAGATYKKLSADIESYGVVLTQDYYFRKVGDRMACMCITWMEGMEEGRDAIMNAFAAY